MIFLALTYKCPARFRVKKKQRIVNLERSVSDLTGRAEDLEREAADLRRENGWLKEIIMLKGSRLTGANLASQFSEGNSLFHMGESSNSTGNKTKGEASHSSSEGEVEAEVSKGGKKKGKSAKR
jgi:hypothetical protein